MWSYEIILRSFFGAQILGEGVNNVYIRKIPIVAFILHLKMFDNIFASIPTALQLLQLFTQQILRIYKPILGNL